MGHLTERQRQLVVDFTMEGISTARIALRIDCSIRTGKRLRKRFRETGEWARKVGSGARKKTTAREDRYLERLARNTRFASLGELTNRFSQTLTAPVSQMTCNFMAVSVTEVQIYQIVCNIMHHCILSVH